MPYSLGVDLGTTYTAAAVVPDGGVPRIVQLAADSQAMPSVISVRDDGEVLAGEVAERRAVTHPARTVREFKRRFGDPAPVVIGGTAYGVDALTGHLLADVIRRVTAVEGEAPTRVALAHPASWGPFRLDLLRRAAELAGVGHITLVPEPVAAALANRDRVRDGALVAVYDLGGGTFDAAVVRDGEVVGTPEGVERLGGVDFDQAVMAHVDAALGGAVFTLDAADPEARAGLARLREDCRLAKEALSSDTEAEIPVMLPTVRTSVRLTRAEFEALVRPRLADSLAVLDRVASSATQGAGQGTGGWDGIDAVLLVGGSSRIPLVAQLVAEHTGRPVVTATNPAFAIALGTADTLKVAAPPTVASPSPASPSGSTRPEPAGPASPPAEPRATKRRLPLLIGVGLLAVAAVVGAVVALGGGGDDGDAASTTVAVPVTTPVPVGSTEATSTDPGSTTPAATSTAVAATTAATTPDTTVPRTTAGVSVPDDGRPVPAPIGVSVGGARLTPVACSTGAALDGTSTFTVAGERLFALSDGDVRAFSVDVSGGCAVSLDTSVFADGVVPIEGTVTDIAASAEVLLVASSAGGRIVDLATGDTAECAGLESRVAVDLAGQRVWTWTDGGPADLLSVATGQCALVASDQVPSVDEVVVAAGGALAVAHDTLWFVYRFDGDERTWTHGGPRSRPKEPYTGIDGVVPCGAYVCVLDVAADRLHLLDEEGRDQVAVALSGALGLPAPTMADVAFGGDGRGYLLVTVTEDTETWTYVFGLAVN